MRTGGPDHVVIAAALADRPGEWAIVKEAKTQSAANAAAFQIKTGRISSYAPAGTYEAVSRTVDGKHRVYARYVGTV